MRRRKCIREAASRLFEERGYAGTSMAAIAGAAGVAPQTVFVVFGNKTGLLAEAIDVALAGDERPIAMADRGPWREGSPTSAEDAARDFARAATEVLDRAGRLIQVADSAARQDPSLEPMRIAGHKGRLADVRRVAEVFSAAGYLRDGISVDAAAELLWTLTSPDTFGAFTELLGWSTTRFQRWIATTIMNSIFH